MPSPSLQRRSGGRRDRWRVRLQSAGVKTERYFYSYEEAAQFCQTIPSSGRYSYTDDRDRITRNVRVESESGCWVWGRHISPRTGYGLITVRGRRGLAHRFAYEQFVGPIPAGLQLDHQCRNRPCVNPDHLEPVTAKTNVHRSPLTVAALNAAKTACPQGHLYDEENTVRQRGGGRLCRTCQNRRLNRRRSR